MFMYLSQAFIHNWSLLDYICINVLIENTPYSHKNKHIITTIYVQDLNTHEIVQMIEKISRLHACIFPIKTSVNRC